MDLEDILVIKYSGTKFNIIQQSVFRCSCKIGILSKWNSQKLETARWASWNYYLVALDLTIKKYGHTGETSGSLWNNEIKERQAIMENHLTTNG
mgnify:CR=1 FL=1